MRIDKWLWAVRLFKTRTLAATACRQGRVTIASQPVKPSRDVKLNDLIVARTGEITRTVRVLALIDHRIGASLVPQYAEDLTPPAEYEKPRDRILPPLFRRPKGAGRPTKRDRRQLDKLF
jgi:ribosome-associated heat shock protein Hsp15